MIRSFKRALPRFLLKNQTPSSSLLQGQKSNVRALSTTDTNRPSGRKPKIVVVGSGWGGYLFTLGIDKKKYDVQMISPSNHFLFTPLLPSSAVGTLEFRAIQEPVRKISGLSEFYHAKALSVDFNQRVVECQSIFEHDKESFQVPYDYLVVSSGCKTNTFNTPGIAENEGEQVWFLKHLYHARQIRNRIVECFERAAIHNTEEKERDRLLTFAIVGGGPTSVEFVGELHDLVLRDMKTYYPDLQKHVSVHLIEAGPRLLPSFHPDLGDLVKRRFEKRGIGVKTNTAVKSMVVNEENAREKYIVLESDGKEIHLPVGLLVWSAGLEQVNFVKSAFNDFKKGPGGRIVVSDCLLAQMLETGACNDPPSQERVFAIGDCAVNLDTPLAPLVSKKNRHSPCLTRIVGNCCKTTSKLHIKGFQFNPRRCSPRTSDGFETTDANASAKTFRFCSVVFYGHLRELSGGH